MTRFAIDPPTLLAITESHRCIDPDHRLVAPNSIRSDVLDLLLLRVRSGELSEEAAFDRHERITEVKMRLLGDRVSRRTAWRIAREHDVGTIHEAEYLAVAKLQADALIATNPELAAIAGGIVPLAALTEVFSD
jgi:predicted nucleic acid-binding protein